MRVRAAGEQPGDTDPGCLLLQEEFRDGKYIYSVSGHDAQGSEAASPHEGALGGSLGDLAPTMLQRFEDEQRYAWRISDELVVRGASNSQVYAMPWTMDNEMLVTSGAVDQEGLTASQVSVMGNAVFWVTATLVRHGINVWQAAPGARPFVRFLGDFTQGAGDLGTDGVDLVWTYGEGEQPNDTVYPERSIMTAPFTADPAQLQPRRLRSQPFPKVGASKYAVGCGYAAHQGTGNNTLVVRLSDGVSWLIDDEWPDFQPQVAIGLTCTDVFILGKYGTQWNIARFRLDSLGPSMPPD
jgi:hypothetical protein